MKHIITFAYYNKSGMWGLISRVVTTTNGINQKIIDDIKHGIDEELGLVNASIPVSCIDVTEPTISIWHLTFLIDQCNNPYKPESKYITVAASTQGKLTERGLNFAVNQVRLEEPDYKRQILINSLEVIKDSD